MNRLREYFEEPPEPERQDDYFEIESHYDTFAVSRETAIEIEGEAGPSSVGRRLSGEARAITRPIIP